MVEKPRNWGRLSNRLISNDIFDVDEVYPQFIHIVDAKNEWNINRDDVECRLSRFATNWEGEMNDFFGAGASYAKVVG